MRKLLNISIPALLIAGMVAVVPFYQSSRELSDDVLRVHILANSNSAADQSLKLSVRDKVVEGCSSFYIDCNDKDEAMGITLRHIDDIKEIAKREIRSRGFDYAVKAEVTQMYFNTRYYDDFTMPAGIYDALRITIGEGDGDNWWCVMYPSLCVGAACEDEMKDELSEGEYRVVTSDQLDFRFKLVEYLEGFMNLFR